MVREFPPARCINPAGVITGFTSASIKDQPLAETFFALRAEPDRTLQSVGSAALGAYATDRGFEGKKNHRRWLDRYGARIVCPPKPNERRRRWPKQLRRWAASIRQIAETVYEKLHNAFGLRRLAAMVISTHNKRLREWLVASETSRKGLRLSGARAPTGRKAENFLDVGRSDGPPCRPTARPPTPLHRRQLLCTR